MLLISNLQLTKKYLMGQVATISSVSLIQFNKMKSELLYPPFEECKHAYLDKFWDMFACALVGRNRLSSQNILFKIMEPSENFILSENEYMKEYLRYNSPALVIQIHEKLQTITKEDFEDLLEKNAGLYKSALYGYLCEIEEFPEIMMGHFVELKALFKDAAAKGKYIVTAIG